MARHKKPKRESVNAALRYITAAGITESDVRRQQQNRETQQRRMRFTRDVHRKVRERMTRG